jgi:hypothetical protein
MIDIVDLTYRIKKQFPEMWKRSDIKYSRMFKSNKISSYSDILKFVASCQVTISDRIFLMLLVSLNESDTKDFIDTLNMLLLTETKNFVAYMRLYITLNNWNN